jgi:hypothetical protein
MEGIAGSRSVVDYITDTAASEFATGQAKPNLRISLRLSEYIGSKSADQRR